MSKLALTQMADIALPVLDKCIEESVVVVVPAILAKFLSSGGLVTLQKPSSRSLASEKPRSRTEETSGPPIRKIVLQDVADKNI